MTGSNKGIGFGIVKELCAKFEGIVYLTSRNEELGLAAVSDLEKQGLRPRYHQLDIDDESSSLQFRDHLKSNYGGLDVLVNNAAIALWPDTNPNFQEKAPKVLNTNYFSTARLCDILFPILRPHSRVVNVSTVAGHLSRIPSQELRDKLASPDLTAQGVSNLMKDYLE